MDAKAVDMQDYYLSLGTNLGNKENNLVEACQFLNSKLGYVKAVAGLYSSEPWGFTSSHEFINTCVLLQSDLPPMTLLKCLKQYENEHGRMKSTHQGYMDRLIDLDIVLVNDLQLSNNDLTIPHAEMHKRKFVLQPLAQIAADLIHPVFHKTIAELLLDCTDSNDVKLIKNNWYENANTF